MINHHQAIVLSNIKYGDSAMITKFFTAENGLVTVMCNGVRKPKSTTAGLLLPLSIGDIVVSTRYNQKLGTLKEIKNAKPLSYLNNNASFGPIRAFLSAIIEQFVQEEEQDQALFDYVCNYILDLENSREGFQQVPLHFFANFLKFVGYLPYPEIAFKDSNTAIAEKDELNATVIQFCVSHNLAVFNQSNLDAAARKECLFFLIQSTANTLQNGRLKTIYTQLKQLYL